MSVVHHYPSPTSPHLARFVFPKKKGTLFTNIMSAQYFGFNVRPTPMAAPSSETNQKNKEQHPDPHQLASLDRVSHEEDSQSNIANSMAQSVLFAGWASFVLGKVLSKKKSASPTSPLSLRSKMQASIDYHNDHATLRNCPLRAFFTPKKQIQKNPFVQGKWFSIRVVCV